MIVLQMQMKFRCGLLVDKSFFKSKKVYFGALTVTSAGRRTRSAMEVALLQHGHDGVGFLL
jgi:hypothetical protein